MSRGKKQTAGKVDGGEVPLEDDDELAELDQPRDLDFNWEEDDDASRRRDPLRRP